jgi:glycosyltransferase involved in cell wall biosynthesis
MKKLSIIFPAYNEGANIIPLFTNTSTVCQEKSMAKQIELIWVDDGSTDDTWERIQDVKENSLFLHIKAGQHDQNRGYGVALRTGFSLAEGEYVTWLPSDGEITVLETLKLFEQIGDADVITSRHQRTKTLQALGNPVTRKLLTKIQVLLCKILLLPDTSQFNGLWITRNDIVRLCKPRLNTSLVRWEILQYAIEHRYTVIHSSTPTYGSQRISGQSKVTNVRTVSRTFWDLFRWRYYRWRNFYAS